jgi:hypothetical protein
MTPQQIKTDNEVHNGRQKYHSGPKSGGHVAHKINRPTVEEYHPREQRVASKNWQSPDLVCRIPQNPYELSSHLSPSPADEAGAGPPIELNLPQRSVDKQQQSLISSLGNSALGRC